MWLFLEELPFSVSFDRACWLMCYANHCQFSNSVINSDTRLTWYQCLLNHSCKRERKTPRYLHAMHSLRFVCIQRRSSCQVFLRRAQSLLRSACLGLLQRVEEVPAPLKNLAEIAFPLWNVTNWNVLQEHTCWTGFLLIVPCLCCSV